MNTSFTKTTTQDGLFFNGILASPQIPTKKIIIHIHGMSGDIYINSFYPAMNELYPANGYAFLAAEHRGTHSVTQFVTTKDELRNIGNAYEIFEDCVLDIQAWVDWAVKEGYEEIWLQGHSLGPSKIAYYVFKQRPENIKGLIFVSPSDMLGWVLDEATFPLHLELLQEAKQLVSEDKPTQLLSKDLDGYMLSAATYVNFFGEGAKDAVFNYIRPELGWNVVNSLNLPVLAIAGTKDSGMPLSIGAYKAMEILEEQLVNSPRIESVVYEGAEHDFEGFGERIMEDVLNFINQAQK